MDSFFCSCVTTLIFCKFILCYDNLSMRKTTRLTQSSTHQERYASEGNDGITKTTYFTCAHTAFYRNKAWFQVDLGEMASIQTVKIYFRKESEWPQYRSRQFYLDVSDLPATEASTAQRTRCYTDYTSAPNFPSNIQSIQCKQRARYVIVETTYDPPDDGKTGAILEICEIKVYGCDATHYGVDCSHECSLNCIQQTCDIIFGSCTKGCKTGFYGNFCNNTCSGCPEGCQRETGECERTNEESSIKVLTVSNKPVKISLDPVHRVVRRDFTETSVTTSVVFEGSYRDTVTCTGANNGSSIKGQSFENSKNEIPQYLVYVFAGLFSISLILNILFTIRAKRCKQGTQESAYMENSPDPRIELAGLNPVGIEAEEQQPVYEDLRETNDVCELPHYEEPKSFA